MRTTLALLLIKAAIGGTALAQIQPASDAPQPMSPAESASKIRLPDGFRIELVASEPLIKDPSCIAFDEYGRMFVCELHGYNIEGHLDVTELNTTGKLDTEVRRLRWELMGGKIAEQARKLQFGVLKLLTDSDGDGRMDRAEVWADDLPPCYGVVAARGGVIVTSAPDIVFFADRDHDGQVDFRETLFTGFHHSVLERGINNPKWGLDNWIYVGAGRHAGTIRGPHLAKQVQLGNQDFRLRADGSAIEPVSGNVGTFGLAMNDIGDRFPCSGGQPAMYALPLPYRRLARNPYVAAPPNNYAAANYAQGFRISQPHPWRVTRAQDPAWVKFYGQRENDSSYFSGGCSGLIYRADRFPAEYRGSFYYCEPSLNLVHRCILTRDGAGYVARRAPGEEQSEFLASTDQWFRPMNLRVGPEGALYIVDMYREIIEDYSAIPRFLQQQYGIIQGADRGRIWRLVATSPELRPRRIVKQDWPARSNTQELASATGDPNPWWRHTAQRLLIERRDRKATHALAAQVRDGKTAAARIHALYSLDGLETLQSTDVKHALGDSDYGVRIHALRLADHWLDQDKSVFDQVLTLTSDSDPRVRLEVAMTLGGTSDPRATAALLRLAQRHGGERWMAAAILSSASRSAGDLLVGLLRNPGLSVGTLPPLAATIGGQRDRGQIGRALNAAQQTSSVLQVAVLEGLNEGLSRSSQPIAESDDGWRALQDMLRSKSPQVSALATRLAAQLRFGDRPELQAVFAAARLAALDIARPTAQREQAVRLLANARFDTVAATARKLLDARQPLALQQAALAALGGSDDVQVGAILLEDWASLTPKSRTAVLKTIFARENRLPALLAALQHKTVRRGDLNAIQREQLIKNGDPEIADFARKLLESSAAGAEVQRRIDLYQRALAGERNLEQGKQIFAKSCLACHKLGDEGFQVGPPLGSVVRKPDEAILLDLLDPSGHIESEYTTYTVVTNEGRTFTGILTSESATSVTLQQEKGVNEVVLRKDIGVIRASELSLMPANLHEQINPAGVADLIAYLRTEFASPDASEPAAKE